MVTRFLKTQLLCVIFCFQFVSTEIVAQGSEAQRSVAPRDSTLWNIKAGDVIPPVSLALAGLVAQGKISRHFQEKIHAQYPNFHSKADEFLPYAPGVISLGLASAGVKGKHKLGDQVILALLSNIIAQGVTQSLKRVIKYPRPDQSDYYSFPSGHTTTAFANATILHEEYGQRSVLYSIGGYGAATAVGGLRILNNKHWLADVLMGAGVGIGATKALYISYPWLQQTVRRMKH
ncbi:phosphatase PAP2 family protein [Dyadobacter fanqingshengii]|uniref:Phosphatase PAP2 family protein n=1 Tax=Dyadobacter fanqingshengii TaxID=2906443 RepID=A0A9X1PFG3_9BACT|nr:phosphatase PAP2 family protein [Dyadobacter fanqingshengii]MCF0043577.1 phosphatase PAP2 family protein [Dyadobacter fanqingshengii]USJ34805.1 phosphatase PAP2 family protein [Dyadobacter fanqingshengii]